MWALNAAPISNGEALRLLSRYKTLNAFQSDLWVLPRHLALLGVREAHPPKLMLPTATLLSAPPRAVPFSALPSNARRRILNDHPPPLTAPGEFALLERTPAATRWRPATVAECFDAAFMQSGKHVGNTHLLCEANFTACLAVPDEVGVLNVQETSNPFLLDPLLCHRDLVTGSPLDDSINSSLTTIASQFRYTSFKWVEAAAVETAGLQICPSAKPHCVRFVTTLAVVHVSQLPAARQELLVTSVPRYALLNSTTKSYVYYGSQWRHPRVLNLLDGPEVADIPRTVDSEEEATPLLLWVAVTAGEKYTGAAKQCTRMMHCNFYNSEQLC